MRLIFGKRDKLEKRAVKILQKAVSNVLETKSQVILAIPGGNSIKGIFELLKTAKLPWKKIHLFLVDESKVPIFDNQSNFKQARETFIKTLIEKKKISKENIHAYNFQKPAKEYFKELKKYGGKFDLVLLGAGVNSEVASLFPKHNSIKSTKPGYIDVKEAPINPEERISASYSLIVKSKFCFLFFFGQNKKEAYKKFISHKNKIKDVPSKLVNKIKYSFVFTDIEEY